MSETATPDASSRPYKVFFIFHGLWAFESRKDRILAHTAFSEDHHVCAGYFEHIGGAVADRTVSLAPCHAELTGVTYGNKTAFDAGKNVMVANHAFLSKFADKRFSVIDVGKPMEIYSTRIVEVPPVPRFPFAGKAGENLHPGFVSMVQVFVYSSANPSQVGLSTSKARPYIDSHKRVAKLHLYAEPPGMAHRFHALEAYTRLAEMFDLEIIPIAPLFTPFADEGIDGLDADDMRSLNEQHQMQSMGVGSKGSNCDALVIDNREWKDSTAEAGATTDPHHT